MCWSASVQGFLGAAEEPEQHHFLSSLKMRRRILGPFGGWEGVTEYKARQGQLNLSPFVVNDSLMLMTSVRIIQRRLEVLKDDLQGESAHIPLQCRNSLIRTEIAAKC